MRNLPVLALNGVTDTKSSDIIDARFLIYASLQAVAEGTIAGTLKIQFSNKKVQESSQLVEADFVDLPDADVAISGTPGSFSVPKFDSCYQWLRVVFTKSGGDGALTAHFNGIGY